MKPRWLVTATAAALVSLVGALPAAQKTDRKSAAEKSESSSNVQEVIAEGVGKTADDALKDALRSAVREVVGAIVDQETRLKNDQIIDDKVLTASSGFVTSYERVGRPKEEGGLIRVKIKAKVERAELVDKLRELKITVRAVDPKRVVPDEKDQRFSDERVKAMTREEMIANKTEILHDLLMDLPKVLEARARTPDRFDFDAARGTLKVEVGVSVDNVRYVQFLKRLALRLDKLSLGKVSGAADAKPKDLSPLNWGGKAPGFQTEECVFAEGPDLQRQPEAWCLWVLTNAVNNGAGTRWAGYILDTDPRKTLAGLAGELKVQVSVRDGDEKNIAEEALDLSKARWLGMYLPRPKQAVGLDGVYDLQSPLLAPKADTLKVTQERSINVLIGPAEFIANWAHVNKIGRGSVQLAYSLTRTHALEVKLDKDEVKRVKDIRCAVLFRAEK